MRVGVELLLSRLLLSIGERLMTPEVKARMRLRVDEWSYPIVNDPGLQPELVAHARRAANHCPVLALRLDSKNV